MKVSLIRCTGSPQSLIEGAARICTRTLDKFGTNSEQYLRSLITAGHLSVIEHASATFSISGISRACMAQITRHRIASYSIQSMRYVKGAPTVTVPESITNTQGAAEFYLDALDATAMAYNKMLELGVPAEDARMVLPIGSHTSMVLTMNFRELLHFFELRLDKSAQWEIREVAKRMLSLIRKEAPVIFEGVKIE